jgi:hypothetical protein
MVEEPADRSTTAETDDGSGHHDKCVTHHTARSTLKISCRCMLTCCCDTLEEHPGSPESETAQMLYTAQRLSDLTYLTFALDTITFKCASRCQ